MDKLKEAILKLANSEPNAPLSMTQNSILQQRLTHFLSSLYTTPDHPPYAWMIQRALEELNEEGGSSEDSISKFIKKEHDNLPWAHTFLLKHHLQMLSENGEILMIDGGHFLLAGGDKSFDSKRKSKKKYLKRKRRWDWEIKQKKRRQKEKKEKELVKHDVQAVKEQRKLDEQQNGICEEYRELNGHQNEVSTNKEDGAFNGRQHHASGDKVLRRGGRKIRVKLEQQSDATEEQLQSSIASKIDVVSNAEFVPIEPPRFRMTEEFKHLEDSELHHQKLSLSGVEETANICNVYPQETLENEQPGDNLPRILSPEAPPGVECIGVENVTKNSGDNSVSAGLDSLEEDRLMRQSSERPAEDQAPKMDDCYEKLSKESPRKQQHEGNSLTNDGSVPSASVLSLNHNQQHSLDAERLEKEYAEDRLKTQKQQKNRHGWQQMKRSTRNSNKVQEKGTATPNAPLLLDLQCQQELHSSDRDREQQQLALGRSSEPKQLSIPRKMTRNQLKGIIVQPASSPASSALRERDGSPETVQGVDKHCRRVNEMIIPDIHGNLEDGEAQQLKKLPKMDGPLQIVPALGEPSLKKQQQLEERRPTPEKLNEDDEPDSLLLQRPARFEAVTTEETSQTDRAQRQLKRWSRDRSGPKAGTRTTVELATREQVLDLTDPQHEVHMERRDHQRRGKPPQNKEDRAKLCSGTISAVATNEVVCMDDRQHEVQLKLERHKCLGRPPKRKEDGGKPGSTSLKNSGLFKKNQNGQGRGRPGKAQ